LRGAVMFEGRVIGRAWIRLPFWTRCGHDNIVAPESVGGKDSRGLSFLGT
jgi:hypothetical protein